MKADALLEYVQHKYADAVTGVAPEVRGDAGVLVQRASVRRFLAAVKADPELDLNVLMDLTALDYLHWEEKEDRFEVVYNLFSISKNHRLFVKVRVPEADPVVDSAVPVWPAADWYEREVWDMFGIRFAGHPGLKRILMYEGFQGHPLRKDYPYNKRQPIIGPVN